MKAVHTIDHVVNTILRWIVMIMLSVMSVVVFAQVVFRIVHLFKHAVAACPPCVVPAFGTNNA